jgi:hypothetical protein
MMYNCFKVVVDGEVYCIVPTRARARSIVCMLDKFENVDNRVKIVEAYIANVF